MTLSIIVPAYNEEENIEHVIAEIEKTVSLAHETLVINDHSKDTTEKIVENLTVKYPALRLINNPNEGGFASALKTGFKNAHGEVIVPVMADLCDELTTIEKMYEKINDGFDIVCGCRYTKNGARKGGSKFKGFLSCSAGWSLYYLLGIPTHDIANAFKMYRKEIIGSFDINTRGFEVSMEITLKAFYKGFKVTEVPTIWKERTRGASNFKVFRLLPSYLRLYFWALKKRIAG